MNTLSWLLYLADVSESVGTLSTIFLILSALLALISYVISWIMIAESNWKPGEEVAKIIGYLQRLFKVGCICLGVFAVFGVAFPNAKTVYMIAASEAGEVVVQSEQARDLMSMIQTKLEDSLGVKKETSE